MANSSPELPMLARLNTDGVSVNESALCVLCLSRGDHADLEASYQNWKAADDTNDYDLDDQFYPVDNPDAVCNGCGATTLEEYVS